MADITVNEYFVDDDYYGQRTGGTYPFAGSGGSGGVSGIIWSGTTLNGVGTYVDPATILSNEYFLFDGTTAIVGNATTAYGAAAYTTTIGSTTLGDYGEVEIIGNRDGSGERVAQLAFRNEQSSHGTKLVGYMYVDRGSGGLSEGELHVGITDAGASPIDAWLVTPSQQDWYIAGASELVLNSLYLHPSSDLGLSLGSTDHVWNNIMVASAQVTGLADSNSPLVVVADEYGNLGLGTFHGDLTYGNDREIPFMENTSATTDFQYESQFYYDTDRALILAGGGYVNMWGKTLFLGSNDSDHLNRNSPANKSGYIAGIHYTSLTEDEVALIGYLTTTGANTMNIGGGDADYNAMTAINFYVAGTTTTATGTLIATIDTSGLTVGTVTLDTGIYITYDSAGNLVFADNTISAGEVILSDLIGGGSMVYPGAGIAVSTGSAWDTSLTDNHTNWDDAYTHSQIAGGDSVHVSTTENTQWDTAYTHSQVTTGNPHSIGYADITDFSTGVSTYETSHATVVEDSDFGSDGILVRSGGSGSYSVITDNSSNWDDAYTHSQVTTGNPHSIGYGDIADFSTGVSTYETSHSDVVVDGDFSANGILYRTGAGSYSSLTGSSSIDTIEDTLTEDSTHIPTSNAVYDAISGLNGTVTSVGLTAGNLIDISGTNPITTSGTMTINVDLSELATSTTNGDGDYFAVVDDANAQYKLTKANIALSGFNNDSGFITGNESITLSGDVSGSGTTSIAVTIASAAVEHSMLNNNAITGASAATALQSTDTFLIYDISATDLREATVTQLQTYMQANLSFGTGYWSRSGTDISPTTSGDDILLATATETIKWGDGDTYFIETSDDNFSLVTGGSTAMSWGNTNITTYRDFLPNGTSYDLGNSTNRFAEIWGNRYYIDGSGYYIDTGGSEISFTDPTNGTTYISDFLEAGSYWTTDSNGIYRTGNVGIGTNSVSGTKLYVLGDVVGSNLVNVQNDDYTSTSSAADWYQCLETNGGDNASAIITVHSTSNNDDTMSKFYVAFSHGQCVITQIGGTVYGGTSGYEFSQVAVSTNDVAPLTGGARFEVYIEPGETVIVIVEDYNTTSSWSQWVNLVSAEQESGWTRTYFINEVYNAGLATTNDLRLIGNSTSNASIGGISFRNIAGTNATEGEIGRIEGRRYNDNDAGRMQFYASNSSGTLYTAYYYTSSFHIWNLNGSGSLELNSSLLRPVSTLGVALGDSSHVFGTSYINRIYLPGISYTDRSDSLQYYASTDEVTYYAESSDIRFKNVLGEIENAAEGLSKINPFIFQINELGHEKVGWDMDKIRYGVSAQDTLPVFEHLVSNVNAKGAEEYLKVDYQSFVPIHHAAINEHTDEIKSLKDEIKELRKLVESLM